MMHDILSDTWVFQEIIKAGLEKVEKIGKTKVNKFYLANTINEARIALETTLLEQ